MSVIASCLIVIVRSSMGYIGETEEASFSVCFIMVRHGKLSNHDFLSRKKKQFGNSFVFTVLSTMGIAGY